jgi:hypothetical protein
MPKKNQSRKHENWKTRKNPIESLFRAFSLSCFRDGL